MAHPIAETIAARPRHGANRRRVAVAATFALVLVVLLVSALLLTAVGIPYAVAGGSALAKIHPATFLSLVVVLVWGWANGGIGRLFGRVATRRPGLVAFGLGIALLLFQAAVVVKLPLAATLDTFLLPLMLFVAIAELDAAERARLETLLHLIVAANSLMALWEYAGGRRLTPMYEADGKLITYEWRATALFGHPLIDAYVTGNYIVALAFGAAPRLTLPWRFAAMGLASLSMIAFGGRVAMVLALVMVGLAAAIGLARLLIGGRFSIDRAIFVVAALSIATIFVVIFVDGGGADRFIERFSQDHGSAQTRLSMFRIFGDLTGEQFWLWPDPEIIAKAQREYAIRLGIESSEIGFAAAYGVLVSVVFFAALAAFMREVVRETSLQALWSVAYFVAVMSSSLGVAAKSSVLAMWVIFTLVLTPREAAGDAG